MWREQEKKPGHPRRQIRKEFKHEVLEKVVLQIFRL